MKKIIFGMLLAVCMMVIVMPMTVYAKRWCEICNNWQDTTVIWKYGDEEHHLGFSTCKKCGTTVESGWEYHSGSGTATCTRGITCDVCGSQYGVLGHDYKLISTRPAASLPAPAFISAAAAATLILNPFLHQDTIWKRSCIPKLPALKKESSPIYAGITAVTFTPSESMPQGTTGTQTGLRMKTIIGISAMSATKKKMFPCTLGIAVRSPFLQPVQHQGKKHTPVLYAATE